MHSLVRIARLNIVFLVSFLALSACESDGVRSLPDPVTDITAPYIVRISPGSEEAGYEIDFTPKILFSEVVDMESVLDGGVKIYSGPVGFDQNSDEQEGLYERSINITQSTVPGEEKIDDEATGRPIDVDATELTLSLEDGRFALNNVYTLSIASSVHDLVEDDLETAEDERNFLEDESSSLFITEPGEWHRASSMSFKYLSEDGTQALKHESASYEPIFRSLNSGETLMIWKQIVDGRSQVWASQYLPEEAVWVVPGALDMANKCQKNLELLELECVNSIRLDRNDESSAFSPTVAMNAEGMAVVLWTQSSLSGDSNVIWINMFNGQEWSGAKELVETNLSDGKEASHPVAWLSESNSILSVWLENDDGINRVRSVTFEFANGFSSGNGLASPIHLDDYASALGSAGQIDLSFNDFGQGVLVWSQEIDGSNRIRTKNVDMSKEPGVRWGETMFADRLEGVVSADQQDPIADVANNGDVALVWRQLNGSVYDLVFSRYVGGNWSQSIKLENDDTRSVNKSTLVYDNLNNLFVAWTAVNDRALHDLSLRQFHHDRGWSTEEKFQNSISSIIADIALVFDYEGNGSLFWHLNGDEGSTILTRDYSKLSKVWLGTEFLADSAASSPQAPIQLETLLRDGRMLSVWDSPVGIGSELKSTIFKEQVEEVE